MSTSQLSPWDDEQAIRFLATLDSWYNMMRLIQTTLKQDPQKYPHQIRAACAIVIMACRENVWPNDRVGILSITDVTSMARRQLSQVKHQFSIKARLNPELKKDPKYRKLLDSIDQEVRILENRLSDNPHDLPEEPPVSWGKFWCD